MTFLVPRTSHEVSQLARIVNKASELSIALTRFAPNSPRLASSCLVAISGCNSGLAGQPHWLSVMYNSILGLEIKRFSHYTEPMRLMQPRHSHHTSVARRGEAR